MRFYLTTAIDYVNSRPHLGTAYEKVTADVIARYKRLCGIDTHFLMGNDEHSQNVYKRAVELGLDPKAYTDRMDQEFRDTWQRLNISFDDFIRTSEPRHCAAVQKLAQASYDAGDIYEGFYEGYYCVGCEAFKQEKDLVDGNCPVHLTRPEWIREKNYFFRLSKYQRPLLRHFEAHPEFLVPEIRRNEILRLLEGGLEDISISRAGQSWGIPLPMAPDNVVYVWYDALTNYASGVGYGTDPDLFARWWPADLHIVGKDITRFHSVVWPAMLMSAGVAVPRQVFGHGWVHFKGVRMSKSLGTSIDPLDAVQRFGPDPLRLYLVKEIAYGSDGDFSWERFEERYNVDLANNLGNLVSRVSAMAHRYRGGRLDPSALGPGRLASVASAALERYRTGMDALALHEGALAAYRIVDATNEFIAETSPWTLAKDPSQAERLSQVLFDAAEAVRVAALLLLPVMPASAVEILSRIGSTRPVCDLRLETDGRWRAEGTRSIRQAAAMWPRLDTSGGADAAPVSTKEKIVSDAPGTGSPEIVVPGREPAAPQGGSPEGLAGPAAAPAATESAPDTRISFDDFMKIELRTGKVLEAENVPKSRKLVKMRVDVGTEVRTIVAGIAESYQPEQLVGRTIAVVYNLKPAKLMGIESNGMVLAASPEGGGALLVSFEGEVPPGTRVR